MKPSVKNHRAAVAFTLRELLVVIITGAVLLMPLLSAMHNAGSKRVKRMQCVANLRQFAQSTQIYAADNREQLPIMSGVVSWPWDLPSPIAEALIRYGMEQRKFYCPGTSPRFNDDLNYLNPIPNSLWNFFGGSARIIGYATTFGGVSSALILSNQNTTILPEPVRLTSAISLPVPSNHERVLLADATVSQNRAGTAANPDPAGSFVNLPGGFMGGTKPHISPHLNGELPAGGNLAFKDGHVDWREFKFMSQRAATGYGFWW